jgi:hypothetical protein
MFAKTLLVTLIAACGFHPGAPANSNPDHPDEIQQKPENDQHFCCSSVKDGKGDGCVAIGAEQINSCQHVLYCAGSWEKIDGDVTCLKD